MLPLPTTTTSFTSHKVSQLLRNATVIAGHFVQDFAHAPAMVQADAVVLSTLALVTARVCIAFGTASKETDPEQSVLRWREAIRTGMREIGGWICSYLVLKAVRRQAQQIINKGVGLLPVPKPPIGFGKLVTDFKAQLLAFRSNAIPLPTPVANTLQALEFTPEVAFANRSVVKTGLQQLQKTALFKDIHVDSALRHIHNWGPITVGSLSSLILSGFMLEWFTLHHADNVAKLITQLTDRRQLKASPRLSTNTIGPTPLPKGPNKSVPLPPTSFSATSDKLNRTQALPPSMQATMDLNTGGTKPDPFAWAYA
jgi:hypothetical protein